jgi:L-fuconolactonase
MDLPPSHPGGCKVIVDAHQHFWEIGRHGHQWPGPDLAAIYRDFLPAQLEALCGVHGVASTLLVQSQPADADTDWLIALSEQTDFVGGVVAWANLAAPHAAERVAELARRPKLRGLRPMLQDLPGDWILAPAVRPALAAMEKHGLVFDALIRAGHLEAITSLARVYPKLAIVIDHAAKPPIASGALEPWAAGIAEAAALPNIACKLSGLVTEATVDWRHEHLQPWVMHLLATFGPTRLIWGSDWPVVELAGGYERWLDAAQRLLAELSSADREAVFGGNAIRTYRLELPN